MLKMGCAVLMAAMIAAGSVMVPGLSPSAYAKTAKRHKGDRLDLALRMASCRQMAWPYYDQSCRKSSNRAVRRVTTDRI